MTNENNDTPYLPNGDIDFDKMEIINADPIYLTGFDDCVVGHVLNNGNSVVCYSIKKMLQNVMTNHNMAYWEAHDFLCHNILFAYYGEFGPVYLEDDYE